MKKLLYINIIFFVAIVLCSCKREDINALEGTKWKTLVRYDYLNQSLGGIEDLINERTYYYGWQSCDADKIFTFTKDRFLVKRGREMCRFGIASSQTFDIEQQSYSYDEKTNKLKLGKDLFLSDFDVHEISDKRMILLHRFQNSEGKTYTGLFVFGRL